MDGNQPADLPPPIDRSPLLPDASGLTRLPQGIASASETEAPYAGPTPFESWAVEAQSDGAEAPRAVLRLRVPADDDPVEAARRIHESHTLEDGIALDRKDLILVLPEGLGWATLARTAAGPGAPPLVAGLADFGIDGQRFADALVLSARAVEDALDGGKPVVVRSRRDEEDARRHVAIEESLRDALRSGQGLDLVYQPAFDTQTRRLIGAEALLRHSNPEYGEIPPMEFLQVAASAGILTELQHWAIGACIDAAAEWDRAGVLGFPISVNVAEDDFFAEDFVVELAARLDEACLDPALLRLEVPEAGVLRDVDRAVTRLEALRTIGVSVALDDFGGEDAPGLAELKRLPIDVLKVHRSFVLGMEAEVGLDALVRGVIALAAVLGIETVAAGVETEGQMDKLDGYGCTAVQGFLLSAPLDAESFESRVRQARTRHGH